MKKNLENIITSSIKQVADEFQKDELAFLALTTKIELPLRDRWAYLLYKKLKSENFIVSREWKRMDLAILKNEIPEALIQLKAMYTFNAALDAENINGYAKYTLDDEKKATRFASKDTATYSVLLVTHPSAIISSKLSGIVKYHTGINKALRKFGCPKEVAVEAKRNINNKFKNRNVTASGELPGGKAFGVGVSVMYWIIRGS